MASGYSIRVIFHIDDARPTLPAPGDVGAGAELEGRGGRVGLRNGVSYVSVPPSSTNITVVHPQHPHSHSDPRRRAARIQTLHPDFVTPTLGMSGPHRTGIPRADIFSRRAPPCRPMSVELKMVVELNASIAI